MQNKEALRRELLAERKAMSEEQRALAAQELGREVLAWWRTSCLNVIGVYWAIRGEPDLSECFAEMDREGAVLALPIVTADDAPLSFARWKPGQAMDHDTFGVSIPQRPLALVEPQAVLVPCVGYNEEAFRIGYGGGFYDRTLALKNPPLALGVAYRSAKRRFTPDPHDLSLQHIFAA